jgi:hypothetical protein
MVLPQTYKQNSLNKYLMASACFINMNKYICFTSLMSVSLGCVTVTDRAEP